MSKSRQCQGSHLEKKTGWFWGGGGRSQGHTLMIWLPRPPTTVRNQPGLQENCLKFILVLSWKKKFAFAGFYKMAEEWLGAQTPLTYESFLGHAQESSRLPSKFMNSPQKQRKKFGVRSTGMSKRVQACQCQPRIYIYIQ